MRVNVADIKAVPGSHKTVPVELRMEPLEMFGQAIRFDQPLKGELEIWNADDRFSVQARLSGEARLTCSRCLSTFSYPIDVTFEEDFREGKPLEGDDEEANEEGWDVNYFEGDHIDFTDTLRENALLALPMKPLCSDTCKGLCSTCGVNLNLDSCQCTETEEIDPRLAGLKKFLQKPDSKS